MHATTLVVNTFDFGLTNLYLYFMIIYLTTTVFILSLAIAPGGILISSHLRSTYKTGFLASLIFFQVFWFTFGFNVIWGQIILVRLLQSLIKPEYMMKIRNLTVFLGSPFAIFAWFMLVKLSREISGKQCGTVFIASFLSLNLLLIPGIAYILNELTDFEIISITKYTFIVLSFLYTIVTANYLLSGKKRNKFSTGDLKSISVILLLLVCIQNFCLFFYETSFYFTLAFILLFFTYGGFLPVYLRYKADLSKFLIQHKENVSFDWFCNKYEISKREKEVILGICEGLSNQQIADKLFISLQTVKDHTHRIYGKTDCNSRAQLIRMVQGGI